MSFHPFPHPIWEIMKFMARLVVVDCWLFFFLFYFFFLLSLSPSSSSLEVSRFILWNERLEAFVFSGCCCCCWAGAVGISVTSRLSPFGGLTEWHLENTAVGVVKLKEKENKNTKEKKNWERRRRRKSSLRTLCALSDDGVSVARCAEISLSLSLWLFMCLCPFFFFFFFFSFFFFLIPPSKNVAPAEHNCSILSLSLLQQFDVSRWLWATALFREKSFEFTTTAEHRVIHLSAAILLWDYRWQNLSLLTNASLSLLHISYFWLTFQIVPSVTSFKSLVVKLDFTHICYLIFLCAIILPEISNSLEQCAELFI